MWLLGMRVISNNVGLVKIITIIIIIIINCGTVAVDAMHRAEEG